MLATPLVWALLVATASAVAAAATVSGGADEYVSPRCQLVRIGGRKKKGFGGWTFCEMRNHSTIFSVGIGNDVTFDVAVARQYAARVDCFDPTLKRLDFEALATPHALTPDERSLLTFYPFGLAATDDVLTFYRKPDRPSMATNLHQDESAGYNDKLSFPAPVLRFQTLMTMAGRTRVDILKVDIEGGEYGLFNAGAESWLGDLRLAPAQINVEFHDKLATHAHRLNASADAHRSGISSRSRSRSRATRAKQPPAQPAQQPSEPAPEEVGLEVAATPRDATKRVIGLLKSCGYTQRYVHPDNSWLMVRTGPPREACVRGAREEWVRI